MQALREYLTPERKKQKVSDLQDELLSDSELEEAASETDNKPPWWDQQQMKMLTEIKEKIGTIAAMQNDITNIKDELANVKLQAEMAHDTVQEALEVGTNVDDRVKALEAGHTSRDEIYTMTDNAIAKLRSVDVATDLRFKFAKSLVPGVEQPDCDKFLRTAVVGGFSRDTPKGEVIEFLNKKLLEGVEGVDEAYAYAYGSVGFIRFNSKEHMYKFLKDIGQTRKPQINGKDIWISTSKTPEERKKAKSLGKFKRVLIETKLAEPMDVKIDYKRGIIFVKRVRIAEWTFADGKELVAANEAKLKEIGINVQAAKIHDAVDELMQQ